MRCLVLVLGLGMLPGCRQLNPDWQGPIDDGTSSGVSDSMNTAPPPADTSVEPPMDTGVDTVGKRCNNPNQCPDGLVCGPDVCQLGVQGDPCTKNDHCQDPTAHCGPDGCQAGAAGEPCEDNDACAEPTAHCGPDGCQAGVAGEPCDDDAACADPTPLCGPMGCQAGLDGEPCEVMSQCAMNLNCTGGSCTP